MANTNAADNINATHNPFSGMTMAQMKKKWSSMTPKQREANVSNFRKAAKRAPKAKPPSSGGIQQKPQTNRVPKKDSRSSKPKAVVNTPTPTTFPSPTVLRRGSKTGAAVDPRERSLRKNKEDAKRTKGSTVKGRKNIAAQVKAASGSSKRNQKTVEARRRRARVAGQKRNLREYLASKNKDM